MASRAQLIRGSILALRAAVTLVFGWAGAAKVPDPVGFQRAIESYALIPPWLAFAAAAYLPWLELISAVALWRPRLAKAAEVILLGLTIVFMAAIASAWARGLDIECGCFGSARPLGPSYGVLLVRDLALAAALAVLLLGSGGPQRVE